MNSLSWLLYTADVVDSLGISMGILCALSVLSAGAGGFALMLTHNDYGMEEKDRKPFWKVVNLSVWVFCVALVVSCITPSKETVYAIAASEMGEKAMATPTAGKAMKALNHWLDKQVEETEKK